MVRIEDLMALGLTRRKAHELAVELGFGKADEYPDQILPAIRARLGTTAKSQPKPGFAAHTAAAEEYAAEAQEDLAYVQEAAENRAAGMLVALDTLTMFHCSTRQFQNKNLQHQVNESRKRVKQVLSGVASFYEPTNFLSQTLAGQLMSGTGEAGSMNLIDSAKSNGDASEIADVELV